MFELHMFVCPQVFMPVCECTLTLPNRPSTVTSFTAIFKLSEQPDSAVLNKLLAPDIYCVICGEQSEMSQPSVSADLFIVNFIM